MSRLGVAVIGAGYWGPNLMRNFLASPDWDLRWSVDLDLERARRSVSYAADVRVSDDLADVLNDPTVDVVAVATPAATHTKVVLACLESGRHVVVEKPLAPTVEEARLLVEAAAARDLVLMLDHTYCYTPVVQHIHDLVASGAIGDMQYFDSVRVNLGLVQPDVDVLWDLAPHDLSILDFILPAELRPTHIAASGADPVGAGHACIGYLTMPIGAHGVAHVHVNWLSPIKVRTTLIGGSKKMVVWDDMKPAQPLSIYDRGIEMGAIDEASKFQAQVAYRLGDMVAPSLPEREALMAMVTELASAIRERRPALTDGQAGLRVIELLDAATRSLDAGGTSIPVGKAL
ncbi:MAG: Gfo/Idh/MocA family oxidoreductase [Actinomycetes bacterium]